MRFPRAGQICAAAILAEFGDDRARYLTADQLAAGGKSRGVVFRWARNRRLRAAIACFADNSRHRSTWAADVCNRYNRARARGCRHPHAIRILGRAWIRILRRAWIDRSPYDPTRHRALSAAGWHRLPHRRRRSVRASVLA